MHAVVVTLLKLMDALPTVLALVESRATEGLALVSVMVTAEGGVAPRQTELVA
jgi:hypothetical protein